MTSSAVRAMMGNHAMRTLVVRTALRNCLRGSRPKGHQEDSSWQVNCNVYHDPTDTSDTADPEEARCGDVSSSSSEFGPVDR